MAFVFRWRIGRVKPSKSHTMENYKFKVEQIDTYQTIVEVKASSMEEAEELVMGMLNACPLDTRSGTLLSSEIWLEKHGSE
jgi:hypothetical protein